MKLLNNNIILLLLAAASSDAALLRGENGSYGRLLQGNSDKNMGNGGGKPDNVGNGGGKPPGVGNGGGKPDDVGNGGGKPPGVGNGGGKPDDVGNGGGKPENPGNSDSNGGGPPFRQPDWVPPCGDDSACGNGNGNGPTKYSVCQVEDGKEMTKCLPETSGVFNFTEYPDNYCGACDGTAVDEPPCGEEFSCKKGGDNDKGNRPSFYSICKVEGNKSMEKCMPAKSGLFNFTEYPDNYCGPCTDIPIVTEPPFTSPPIEPDTIIDKPEPENEISIVVEDSAVTIPGEAIGGQDITVDFGGFLPGGAMCFSGSSMVETQDKGYVRMMDLKLGDKVKVNGENQYEPVYSFGHKDSARTAEFLQITTSATNKPLEVTAAHLVALENGRHVPASHIKTGDLLITAYTNNEATAVTHIKTVTRKGIYAPFTASGTIVVNNIVASNYVSFQDSEYLKIGSLQTPISYHWLFHTFNSVHRLLVQMVGIVPETYTEEGISRFADMPHQVFSWLLRQNAVVLLAALVSLILPAIVTTSLLEWALLNPVMMITMGVVGFAFVRREKAKKKIV
eukprot:CAMPEP_0178913066 /NCGR_PEP_ID=MMETSP0786-20121207/10627_1 /TAXON_ID=186022 /ORGANISM="Thalassionema frauenfeldii, Strain CCMP 1798" /LENGTH=561 /DNA_ID=CAMNT_0020585749 /DNA_START=12 /DNA_END=1697 /DNA_ORIENTATION=-